MRTLLLRCGLLLAVTLAACDAAPTELGVPPAAITLTVNTPSLAVGDSMQLTAAVTDSAGNALDHPPLTWTSGNESIATVSARGFVAAVAAGTTIITASVNQVSAQVAITVTSAETAPPPASGLVTLPATLINTAMPPAPAAGGQVISVASGGNLQAALDAARPGDVIELARGATYTGNFVLRHKGASSDWIVIRPAAGAALPAEGVRMTPALAAQLALPRIVTPNVAPAVATELSAHHYRLVGLEITASESLALNYGLVLFGNSKADGQTSLSVVPHDLILDRSWVHGHPNLSVKRCVAMNSATTAVVDSYLSACHANGQDAQAIGGWNGPGPFRIVNNYLEASGENIMFGGADPAIPNMVPSDIEIRRNHLFKPASWHDKWTVKNLFELKNAQRVLVEANVMDGNWAHAQDGTAVLFKSVNQDGDAPWSVTQDVTFRRNVIRNVGSAFSISANPEGYPAIPARRIHVEDNLVYNVNTPGYEGAARGFLLGGGALADVSIVHNTIVGSTTRAVTFGPHGITTARLVMTDNILEGAIHGDNAGAGSGSFSMYAPDGTFARNVLVVASGSGYPAGNSYPGNVTDVGFEGMAAGDFRLSVASPFKGTSNGRDPGADVAVVHAATQGVVLP